MMVPVLLPSIKSNVTHIQCIVPMLPCKCGSSDAHPVGLWPMDPVLPSVHPVLPSGWPCCPAWMDWSNVAQCIPGVTQCMDPICCPPVSVDRVSVAQPVCPLSTGIGDSLPAIIKKNWDPVYGLLVPAIIKKNWDPVYGLLVPAIIKKTETQSTDLITGTSNH
jgi:hypothetical protein